MVHPHHNQCRDRRHQCRDRRRNAGRNPLVARHALAQKLCATATLDNAELEFIGTLVEKDQGTRTGLYDLHRRSEDVAQQTVDVYFGDQILADALQDLKVSKFALQYVTLFS